MIKIQSHTSYTTKPNYTKKPRGDPNDAPSKSGMVFFGCDRCHSRRIGPNKIGEIVCFECGMVSGPTYQDEVPGWFLAYKRTYKRIFYFNERCARWTCTEPSIPLDIWSFIVFEANQEKKYGKLQQFKRGTVSKVLRSIKLPEKIIAKHKSKKFKCNPMTKKRFYDKYFEKWKTILERLGVKTNCPSSELVLLLKELFPKSLIPFEIFRHKPNCTMKTGNTKTCAKYFGCLSNFINYDFLFLKLIQIAEIKYGHEGAYMKFKDDFTLVSKKIRDNKLRPLWKKICDYNQWPCPDYE